MSTKQFEKFIEEIASNKDSEWEYEDGTPMSGDARAYLKVVGSLADHEHKESEYGCFAKCFDCLIDLGHQDECDVAMRLDPEHTCDTSLKNLCEYWRPIEETS